MRIEKGYNCIVILEVSMLLGSCFAGANVKRAIPVVLQMVGGRMPSECWVSLTECAGAF